MSILKDKAKKYISPVLGKYFPDFEVISGEGIYLYDSDGKRYIDFTCGIGVTNTGHCHPTVVKAITKQASQLIHICAGIAHYEPHIKLAERLVNILPFKEASVVFSQSGSEAIEASLKLARYVTKKKKLVAFTHSFHGRTLGALSVTYKEKYKKGYEGWLIDDVIRLDYPYYFHHNTMEYHDYVFQCIANFKKAILENNDIAAVIIEPILGEGGYVPAPVEFIQELRKFTEEQGILLIFDEVQSGFGRTGTMFAMEHYDVVPDIVALAKGIASGMPLGACVAKKELMDQWTTSAHGGTYIGNPVSCAASLATISVIEEEGLLENAYEIGKFITSLLHEAQKKLPVIGDVRGVGLMIGVEFIDPVTKEPSPEIVKKIKIKALEKGLVIISCGDSDQCLRLIPALIITKAQAKEAIDILISTIQECL
ncbi:MAG: aminotransferase class III-fold pyridoxal phosphate-dependent enzyme [Candidatus Margulisbacteria bacterium]|nr:aminotransferase class III-fold pyridoxal phosphate-dependent enzyme [Candidatus Margulisiibacteriota bacterium]